MNFLFTQIARVRETVGRLAPRLAPYVEQARPAWRWLHAAWLRVPLRVRKVLSALPIAYGVYLGMYTGYRFVPESLLGPYRQALAIVFTPGEWTAAIFGLSQDQLRAREGKAISVRAMVVATESIEPAITSAGRIEAFETVNVVSKNAGRVEKVHVDEGMRVDRGAVLVQLERLPLQFQHAQQRAALEQAQARLRLSRERYELAKKQVEIRWNSLEMRRIEAQQLRAELDRARTRFEGQRTLYEEGGLSPDAFSQARTELIGREAAYLNARKNLEIATIGFRDEDLRGRGIAPPANPAARFRALVDLNTRVEKAEAEAAAAEVSAAQASLSATARLLEETTIRAPIGGLIAERNTTIGEEVMAGIGLQGSRAVVVIVSIDKVYAVMQIPETEAVKLSPGMAVSCAVDVYREQVFAGTLSLINPVIAERSHTVEVKALIENAEHRLKPGMFLRARIVTGEARESAVVPVDALAPQSEGKAYAFVIREGRAYRISVETGERLGERIEIKNGLKKGDILALEKFALLRDGQPVLAEVQQE